jgi:serine phosphatase RsbU (regulator of sigma subunit)
MSAIAPPQGTGAARRGGWIHNFWQRLSEGRRVDELWAQFKSDARASYSFYGKEIDRERTEEPSGRWRPLQVAKEYFWALILKLSPARRVMLLVALVLLTMSGFQFRYKNFSFDLQFDYVAALLFLLLLSLELADKVTMKRDLEIAREIQSWLVPVTPPAVPGASIAFAARPQNSVAGDYYDAFYPRNDGAEGGQLLLVIADVAGKSVPAALLMATLQASLHTIAAEFGSLEDLVTRLNAYASAHSLDGRRFTTAVLAQYDPVSRRLRYVNAGHNAPVLRRAAGATERMDIGGLPLGIMSAAAYGIGELQLAPGDTLVFYTDGVVEAVAENGSEFSEERWLATITAMPQSGAPETLHYLMTQVDQFTGAAQQFDDITCLVFRCD